MKKRNFLKAAALAGGALAFPYLPKWIRIPASGLWVETEKNLWLWQRPTESSVILLRNIGGVDDKRIVLSNSNFARALPASLGAWTQIRLALRYTFNGSTGLTSTPRFALGFCAGSTNIFLDALTTNWIGFYMVTASPAFTAAVSSNMAYYSVSFNYGTKVGSTLTGSAASGPYCPADATAATRRMFFVSITKGSPNYSLSWFYTNALAAAPDVTQADFLSQAPLSVPAFANHSVGGPWSIAFTDTVNPVTHCNVAWDRSSVTCEICDLAIVKLA